MVNMSKSETSSRSRPHTTMKIPSRACFFYLPQLFPSLLHSSKSQAQFPSHLLPIKKKNLLRSGKTILIGKVLHKALSLHREHFNPQKILRSMHSCVKKEPVHSPFVQIQTSRQPLSSAIYFLSSSSLFEWTSMALYWAGIDLNKKGKRFLDRLHCLNFRTKNH